MAPTICSGKKRQTRTIATTNIRRHRQGSHQLNQALSNIVNYVAKDSMNPRTTGPLRIHTHKQTEKSSNNIDNGVVFHFNHLTQTSETAEAASSLSSNHHHAHFSFISDNAVTSSTRSDTENSLDLRLTNETFTQDSTATYGSNTTNLSTSTSLSSTSFLESTSSSTSSQRDITSPSTSPYEERRFQKYANLMPSGQEDDSSDNDVTDLLENDNEKVSAAKKERNQTHSSYIRKPYYASNDFDSQEDEYDSDETDTKARELNSQMSYGNDSDLDMDRDEADSMTSLDTEKSAKLKRGNHPLLRDKFLAKQRTNNNSNNTKALTNLRNTDGLLSIAIKTIKLVKRNQLLQQRLTQLQLETSEFIQSVLANPENRHFRDNIKQKAQEIDNV